MSTKAFFGKIINICDASVPKLLLITDSAEICGRGVVYALVKSHLRLDLNVHYLTTALSTDRVRSFISSDDEGRKITFYDGYSDPAGWENREGCIRLSQSLDQIIDRSCLKGPHKYSFVIDKFDDLLNHQDSLELIRKVHSISKDEHLEQLIIYSSRDCIPESILSALCHIVSGTLHLQPAPPRCRCKIMIKRPSGKVVQSYEEFTLTPELTVQDNKVVEKVKKEEEESSDSDAVLAAQTTFSLSLTEEQRRSKNQLLLPHTRVQSTGGQIHYTPDDVDDWDEEDPDDDLDI